MLTYALLFSFAPLSCWSVDAHLAIASRVVFVHERRVLRQRVTLSQ